jgi:hypothetical protein
MHGGLLANAKVKEAEIVATITRADGTIEELGRLSYYHRNPLKRWWGNFRIYLKRGPKR